MEVCLPALRGRVSLLFFVRDFAAHGEAACPCLIDPDARDDALLKLQLCHRHTDVTERIAHLALSYYSAQVTSVHLEHRQGVPFGMQLLCSRMRLKGSGRQDGHYALSNRIVEMLGDGAPRLRRLQLTFLDLSRVQPDSFKYLLRCPILTTSADDTEGLRRRGKLLSELIIGWCSGLSRECRAELRECIGVGEFSEVHLGYSSLVDGAMLEAVVPGLPGLGRLSLESSSGALRPAAVLRFLAHLHKAPERLELVIRDARLTPRRLVAALEREPAGAFTWEETDAQLRIRRCGRGGRYIVVKSPGILTSSLEKF